MGIRARRGWEVEPYMRQFRLVTGRLRGANLQECAWLVGYWKEGAKDKRTEAEVTGRLVLAGLSHYMRSPNNYAALHGNRTCVTFGIICYFSLLFIVPSRGWTHSRGGCRCVCRGLKQGMKLAVRTQKAQRAANQTREIALAPSPIPDMYNQIQTKLELFKTVKS